MSPCSRRRVLTTVSALLAGAAGCTSSADRGTPTPSPTARERAYEHCVGDPTARHVRQTGGEPLIRSSAHSPLRTWTDTRWVVASPDERDALAYPADAAGIDEVAAFVTDTDLSAHSVLIHQYEPVVTCETLRLESLKYGESEPPSAGGFAVALDYAGSTPEEGCEDADPVEVTVVRIPAEIEEISAFAWGTAGHGRDDC